MAQALVEANLARDEGEVPVGAVAVLKGRIVGRGHNRNDALQDPTAHAEIIALSAAAQSMANWRLSGVTLYVTMEPCLMCTGALILSRVRRVVFGIRDEKFGACGSVYDIPWDNRFSHKLEVKPGVLEDECRRVLQLFFQQHRQGKGKGEVRRVK
jgi:tRNA(adenine34) deaminase